MFVNVSDCIDHEDDSSFERIAIDKELERVQTRPVDEMRVGTPAEYYLVNPPRVIEVITWENPAVVPPSPLACRLSTAFAPVG